MIIMRLYTPPQPAKHSSINTSLHLPNRQNSPTTHHPPPPQTNPPTPPPTPQKTHNKNAHPSSSPLQNLLQLLLLLPRQGPGELDIIPDDKVAPPPSLLRHPQIGVRVVAARLRGAALVDDEVLAIDGGDGAFPARQRLFEVELEGEDDVVAFAGKEGVLFLLGVSVVFQ